ncbi:MAG TPA: diguanylate cyclase [Actinophytocola sp.]|uniref:diguanylate cyclase n=1 Tax=Actinophytocola sp. TaxID=1872138 RepID=UPI002F93B2FC
MVYRFVGQLGSTRQREARMVARQVRSVVGRAWILYLVGGVLVVGAYYVATRLDAPPVVRVTLYCLVSASSAAAVLIGCWHGLPRGKPRVPWLFLGFSQVIYAVADILFYFSHNVLGQTTFPAAADAFYLLHYPLVVVGLILLIRRRTPGHDLASVLDAATLAVAVGMLSWLYLIGPQARTGSFSLVTVVSVAYPVMDLAMFAVALRLILGPGRRPVSFMLLAVNLLAIFTADTIYVMQQLSGTYTTGNFLDAIWLGGNLALGTAALHPTVGRVEERADPADIQLTPFRLAMLAGAALIAPSTLVLQYSLGVQRDILVIAAACAALFMLTIGRLAGLVADQRRLATTDVLTGLRTRRFFGAQLPVEIVKARRSGAKLAVLIVDIDHFKSINDRYGHPAGDRVLVEVARRLRESVRPSDVLARYGGEEFALVVASVNAEELAAIGERLRNQVASSQIQVATDVWLHVTVSIGTASLPMNGGTPAELITTADRALYAAKAQGRDRVVQGNSNDPDHGNAADMAALLVYLQRVADEVDGWLSTSEHGRAVGRWAALVAQSLGHDKPTVCRTELAGRLHDVGKVLVPKDIWCKPAALTTDEFELVRQHPGHGYRMLSVVPDLADVAEIIHQHHERMDGRGYPLGLAGEQIRIEARIVAVCDSWAAMLAERPYQSALSHETACGELMRGRGSQFDTDVVDAFLELYHSGQLGSLHVRNEGAVMRAAL